MTESDPRYSRHVLLSGIGEEGQKAIRKGTAVVVGLGGLGSTSSILLARSGVGTLRLVDPDLVDMTNMQRQGLYDEADAQNHTPKAAAARQHLARVNSQVNYEVLVEALDASNAERIVRGATVVVDGLDNFKGRDVLNRACARLGIPWVHGAAVSTHGTVTTIVPGETPCYACIVPDAGSRVAPYTSANVGVFAPTVFTVASIQACEALKVLAGRKDDLLKNRMLWIDLWNSTFRTVSVSKNPDCPVCAHLS
ncbi:MAG: HesA/MoeB/ThiF family protein [Bacillota bacterium]